MTKHRWEHAHDWLDHRFAEMESDIQTQLMAVEVDDALITFQRLRTFSKELASQLDGDQIQNRFQSDMDADGFFDVLIKDEYPKGECPDCGEDIPEFATPGESCENCEHVFTESRPNDD